MTRSRLQFIAGCLITLLFVVSFAIAPPIATAQLPSFTPPGGTQPVPAGVERRGTLESTGVRLDGKELFRIASPTVLNRSEPGTQIPVEVRAKQIDFNLSQLVTSGSTGETPLNPETLRVVIETVNGQPVLFAKDQNLAEAQVLLTVTDTDAQYHAASKEALAERWRVILAQELRQALALRRPEALQQQIAMAIKVLLLTALLTLLLGAAWTVLGRRKHRLEQQQTAERNTMPGSDLAAIALATGEPIPDDPALWLLHELRIHFGLARRLQTVQFLRWLLFWGIAFVWVIGLAYGLGSFPQTRYIARQVVVIPIVVLITWFLTGLVNRLTDFATDRFIQSREQEQSLTPANLQRISTIANVTKGLKMFLLYTVSVLWVLHWLNLASGTILTIGAVIALAVSFAAQNLVKDFVNGFLILLEDQFRIGDMVKVGTVNGLNNITGLVENLNLRLTQLRSPEGNLITIPNSTIAQIENMSRNWARADLRIIVAYDTDVDCALAIVRDTIDQMATDPAWSALILIPQELVGVEQLSHAGIDIRIWIRTAPLKQWDVSRELRRRLKIAFDREQVQIGIPQQIWLETMSSKLIQ